MSKAWPKNLPWKKTINERAFRVWKLEDGPYKCTIRWYGSPVTILPFEATYYGPRGNSFNGRYNTKAPAKKVLEAIYKAESKASE